MKPQPDQIFHDKLSNYSRPAPSAAWDRIEDGLQRRKKIFVWRAVAASVFVITVASFALWQLNSDSTALTTALNTESAKPSPNVKENTTESPLIKSTIPAETIHEDGNKPVEKVAEERVVKESVNKHAASEKERADPAEEEVEIKTEPEIIIKTPSVENAVASNTETLQPAFQEQKNITLVMSREESENYLVKNTEAEATPGKKKTSTFKQVLKKAKDLKNNQDPFGDLRQMKNEILALNFKSDKRGQKK